MSFSVGDLIATLKADVSGFQAGMTLAQRQLTAFKAEASTIGTTLLLGVTVPLTALSVAAFKAASDVERSSRAFQATFGNDTVTGIDAAGRGIQTSFRTTGQAAQAFADTLAKSLGVRIEEVQNQMTGFQRILDGLNFRPEQALAGSEALTLAAQQIAGRFGDIEGATQALTLGLAGSTRGLRNVGIVIDMTAQKQLALNMGWIKSGEMMTAQARSAANLVLILRAVLKQYGDLAPSMDTPMGRLRQMAAATLQAAEALGKALMPAMTAAMQVFVTLAHGLTDLITWFGSLPGWVKGATEGLVLFVAALGPGILLLGKLAGLFTTVMPVITGVGRAMTVLNGIQITLTGTTVILSVAIRGLTASWLSFVAAGGPMIVALLALGAAFIYVATHVDEVDKQTTLFEGAVIQGFYGIAIAIVDALRFATQKLQDFASGPLGLVARAVAALHPEFAGFAAAISALGSRGTPGLDALKTKLENMRDDALVPVNNRLVELQTIIDANANSAGRAGSQFDHMGAIVRRLIASLAAMGHMGPENVDQIAKATKNLEDGLHAVALQAEAMRGVAGSTFDEAAARATVLQTGFTELAKAGVGLNAVIGTTGLTLRQIGQQGFGTDQIASAMYGLTQSMVQVGRQTQVLGPQFDSAGARAQAMRSTFDALSAKGVTLDQVIGSNGQTLRMLGAEMERLQKQSQGFQQAQQQTTAFMASIKTAMTDAEPPVTRYEAALAKLRETAASLGIPFSALKQVVNQMAVDMGVALDVAKVFRQALGSAVSGLFRDLGAAIGNGQNIFKGLGSMLKKTLGDLMVTVGEAMIAFGIAAAQIQKLITNPYLAIAAGAALVALGAALSASAQSSVNAATGGGGGTGGSYNASVATGGQAQGNVTIVLPSGPVDFSNPDVVDALQRGIEAATNRGVTVQRRYG